MPINGDSRAARGYRDTRLRIFDLIYRMRGLEERDVALLKSVVDAFEGIDG